MLRSLGCKQATLSTIAVLYGLTNFFALKSKIIRRKVHSLTVKEKISNRNKNSQLK